MTEKPNCACPPEKLKEWCVKDCEHCLNSTLPEDSNDSDLGNSLRKFKPGQLETILKSLAENRINSAIPYKRFTWRDCPFVCPCLHCTDIPCTKGKCQKLWDFIAARGDWVSSENRKLEELYGPSKEMQVMFNCPRKGTPLEGSCKDCLVRSCYVGNVK